LAHLGLFCHGKQNLNFGNLDSIVVTSTGYGLDGFGFEPGWEAKFFLLVKNCLKVHTAFCIIDITSLS